MSSVSNVYNILVLGVGGNVSQGIIKALRLSKLPLKIFGACVSEYSKGLYLCDAGYLCPYARDKKFIPWVIQFCNNQKIDMIFTGVEENIIKLAQNIEILKKRTNALFISSSYEQLRVGQNKFLTCQWLEKSGCNFPKYHLWKNIDNGIKFAEFIGYPVIAKPCNGKSAKGVYIIHNSNELADFGDMTGYVLEEYIGDETSEYTIGCYSDKAGRIKSIIPMQRKLHNGTTVWAKTVDNPTIVKECKKICEKFRPIGPLNIQMRLDITGKPICFEMNVRFSGTTAIRANLGFEDVKALVLEYLYGQDNIDSCFELKQGEVFRYDEEMYLINGTTEKMGKLGKIENIKSFFYL